MDDTLLNRKISILLVDDNDGTEQKLYDWLEKWEGQYRFINETGGHNEIVYNDDLYCTQAALEDLPEEFSQDSPWTRGEITEEQVIYGAGPRTKLREKQVRNLKKNSEKV